MCDMIAFGCAFPPNITTCVHDAVVILSLIVLSDMNNVVEN